MTLGAFAALLVRRGTLSRRSTCAILLAVGPILPLTPAGAATQEPASELMIPDQFVRSESNRNRSEREIWLQDNGFGIFVHWSLDSQLGIVISHSLVGASGDYIERYIEELPQTFNPKQFDPESLARLFVRAGARYTVFTAKHHSGFAMWDTETTNFGVMNTPYGKDVVRQYVRSMRNAGLDVGLYYSPEDFVWSYRQGVENISRVSKEQDYAPLRKSFRRYVEAQVTELYSNYGRIDTFFNDGNIFGFANEVAWNIQPDTLITRSAIPTPEQFVPSVGFDGAWETVMTMTDQWHYKPNDVKKKSPMNILHTLVETRAKGGALLLNVGLRPDGRLGDYEYQNLVTLGAWNFINSEALFNVRPWVVTHEGPIWFTRRKNEPTVYAVLFGENDWARGERRSFMLRSVRATDESKVSVLGMSGQVVEYMPHLRGQAAPTMHQREDGLHLSVLRAQRVYNNHRWPYPLVLKLENVRPNLIPPVARTLEPVVKGESVLLKGELTTTGDAEAVQVGFEFRHYKGFIEDYAQGSEALSWTRSRLVEARTTGPFEVRLDRPTGEGEVVYRAIVLHPTGVVVEGNEERFDAAPPPRAARAD